MLRLGRILISHLVATDLFMQLLSGLITTLLGTHLYTEGVFECYMYIVRENLRFVLLRNQL